MYSYLQEMISRIQSHVTKEPSFVRSSRILQITCTTPCKMPRKLKTSRREHSSETIAVILKLHSLGYTAPKISTECDGVPKSTVTSIIRRANLNPNQPYQKAHRAGRPPKLSARAERRLVRFLDQNPFETLASLSTPSKSGHQLHHNTTRKYLKKNERYAFRPRHKPFLTKKHKACRLKFAKQYVKWEDSDWDCVAF